MKSARLLALTLFAALSPLLGGCSSLIFRRGPDINQYHRLASFTRADVVRNLGAPRSYKLINPPISLRTFQKGENSSLRVARIDEYLLRGHVMDQSAFKDAWATSVLGAATLGLSELIFLPCAIGDIAQSWNDVHLLTMYYSPAEVLVGHELREVEK